jgi:hypothetical protein
MYLVHHTAEERKIARRKTNTAYKKRNIVKINLQNKGYYKRIIAEVGFSSQKWVKYTQEEEDLLLTSTLTIKELAIKLNRSISGIVSKRRALKLLM